MHRAHICTEQMGEGLCAPSGPYSYNRQYKFKRTVQIHAPLNISFKYMWKKSCTYGGVRSTSTNTIKVAEFYT